MFGVEAAPRLAEGAAQTRISLLQPAPAQQIAQPTFLLHPHLGRLGVGGIEEILAHAAEQHLVLHVGADVAVEEERDDLTVIREVRS